MSNRQNLTSSLRQVTRGLLAQMAAERRAMAERQRADLSKVRLDLTKAEETRRTTLNTWRKGIGRGKVVSASPQSITEVSQPEMDEMGIAEETVQAPQVSPSPGAATTPELGEEVVRFLTSRPDGTRLVEMEEKFGLKRIQMARVVRTLMDEGKLEKRDRLYFLA